MFTYNGKDVHRPIPTSRVHLPFKRQIIEILPEKQKTEDDEVRVYLYAVCWLLMRSHLLSMSVGRPCPSSTPSTRSAGHLGTRLLPLDAPRV